MSFELNPLGIETCILQKMAGEGQAEGTTMKTICREIKTWLFCIQG